MQLDMLRIIMGASHMQVASAIGEESKLQNSAIAGLVSALPQSPSKHGCLQCSRHSSVNSSHVKRGTMLPQQTT